jgi:hypothetical protein
MTDDYYVLLDVSFHVPRAEVLGPIICHLVNREYNSSSIYQSSTVSVKEQRTDILFSGSLFKF